VAKSFLRWGNFFKLCPIALKYVQQIFPGGSKYFFKELFPPALPLVTGLSQVDVSYCVNGFRVDSGHDRAPFVLVIVVALFMVPFLFIFSCFQTPVVRLAVFVRVLG